MYIRQSRERGLQIVEYDDRFFVIDGGYHDPTEVEDKVYMGALGVCQFCKILLIKAEGKPEDICSFCCKTFEGRVLIASRKGTKDGTSEEATTADL